MPNFSININSHDLRATLIRVLTAENSRVGADVGTDPATLADEIMVTLDFNSGYIDGDYAPGYVDYAKGVGLISEPKDIDFAKHSESYKKHIGSEQQQIKLAQLNDSYGVAEWFCRDDGTMVITDEDGDTYDVRPDGSIIA